MGLYLWLKEQTLQDIRRAFHLRVKGTYVRELLMDLRGVDAM